MLRKVKTQGRRDSRTSAIECTSAIEPLEGRQLFDGATPVPPPAALATAALPPPQYDRPIGPPAPLWHDIDYSDPRIAQLNYNEWLSNWEEERGLLPHPYADHDLPLGPPTPWEFLPPAGEFNAEGASERVGRPGAEMTGRKG
jgi:hypothetical protein